VAAPALFALAADEIRPQTRLVDVEIRRQHVESISNRCPTRTKSSAPSGVKLFL
jgi:hypothetical protein